MISPQEIASLISNDGTASSENHDTNKSFWAAKSLFFCLKS